MYLDIRPRAKRTDQVDQFTHGGFSSLPCVDDGYPSQISPCEGPTSRVLRSMHIIGKGHSANKGRAGAVLEAMAYLLLVVRTIPFTHFSKEPRDVGGGIQGVGELRIDF